MAVNAADWDPLYGEVKGMHVWRDMLCLPCMPKDLMEEMIDEFVFRPDDTLLVSYPQSSFNWMQEVLWHLHHLDKLDDPVESRSTLAERVPFLEHEFRLQDPRSLPQFASPRLLKTHLAYNFWSDNLKPVKDEVKVILWVADPKDVLVNYHHFFSTKGKQFNFPTIEWNKFFDLFKQDKLFEGNWYETNKSWLKAFENSSNFLMLAYEKSRADKEGTVRKVADFLGISVTDDQIKKLANVSEFDKWPMWSTRFNEEQKKYTDELTKINVAGTALEQFYPCDKGIL